MLESQRLNKDSSISCNFYYFLATKSYSTVLLYTVGFINVRFARGMGCMSLYTSECCWFVAVLKVPNWSHYAGTGITNVFEQGHVKYGAGSWSSPVRYFNQSFPLALCFVHTYWVPVTHLEKSFLLVSQQGSWGQEPIKMIDNLVREHPLNHNY